MFETGEEICFSNNFYHFGTQKWPFWIQKSASQLATPILHTKTTQHLSNQRFSSDFRPLPFLNH